VKDKRFMLSMGSIGALASKIFGSANDRKVKTYRPKVATIAAFEAEVAALTDDGLRARTKAFKRQIAEGTSLDELLPAVFATVREGAKRSLKQRHFDVQMIGGMVLHGGNIAEMKTGEGKTLVATLPVYLNALTGRGVHVVTVNDYLAKRDSEWMGQVYRFLGLTVGCIVHGLDDDQRRDAYNCDVTYGTNNEFGFDYLRDNMKSSAEEMVQFGHRPAIRGLKKAVTRLEELEDKSDRKAAGPLLNELMNRINRNGATLDRLYFLSDEATKAGWEKTKASIGEILQGLGQEPAPEAAITGLSNAANHLTGAYEPFGLPMTLDDAQPIEHHFAIVDEVDSILIDEARTPLIISGPTEDRAELYNTVDALVLQLKDGEFDLDLKQKQVALNEAGNERMEQLLRDADMLKGDNLYDIENVTAVHHVNQALKAHKLFHRDRDYIVKDGEVIIIDEFTGRMMQGRRYSEGLHQALEAKEHVEIKPENVTLASITFQNYFRLYDKLAGMTGTASTEANEFMDIYGLDVIEVPTNLGIARRDEDDEVYRTSGEKHRAIIAELADCYRRGQPVLVGTTSIEKSEELSNLLKDRKYLRDLAVYMRKQADSLKAGKEDELIGALREIAGYIEGVLAKSASGDPIPHKVLNARFHEQEATIVAQAGVPGGVTIATNMAGRGTDIQLGGNIEFRLKDWLVEQRKLDKEPSEVEVAREREVLIADIARMKQQALDAGGLYVIGTERHESRRIDNQLRGRSGRQGDPGRSKFYLSLEDDLMKIFGGDRMDGMLTKLGLKDGEAIVHVWINKALEKAQQKVEARNFDSRKYVLKYDDVMNDQRKVIFERRIDIMAEDDVSATIQGMREEIVHELIAETIPETAYAEQWNTDKLGEQLKKVFDLDLPVKAWAAEEGIADQEIKQRVMQAVEDKVAAKDAEVGPENMRHIEKMVLLQTLDHLWREHIVTLEHLRHVIGFRGYGQRDPVNEYKQEGFQHFETMLTELREATVTQLSRVSLAPQETGEDLAQQMEAQGQQALPSDLIMTHDTPQSLGVTEAEFALADSVLRGGQADDGSAEARRPLQSRSNNGAIDPKDPTTWGRPSRNQPCPCGTGKKYKHCHGKSD
jgi:preprotein translocase subunit SecA